MSDKIIPIIIGVLLVLFVGVTLWAAFDTQSYCTAQRGIVVRGLWGGFECVERGLH